MPANTSPVFSLVPNVSGIQITTANTKSDGAGTIATDLFKVFTAGSNGSFVQRVRFTPTASAASTLLAATVLRVFVCSTTSGAVTNANCWCISETGAAAQTGDGTTNPVFYFDVPLNFAIPTGYTILVSTAVSNNASTAWMATAYGGDY